MTFTISFIVYTLFIVFIGVYSARYARRSDEDYFLAGRSLGPWVAALSASASSESGWVTLGLVGIGFKTGFPAYWIVPGCVFGFMFNWFVIAGRMRQHAADIDALTIPDFFGFTFKERLPILRIVSVIVILTAMWLYVGAQFAAAGDAFAAAFTGLDYSVGVVLGVAIVLAYTVLGGFRAACWTDFVQGLMMVGTLVIFPIYLVTTQHGFGFIAQSLEQADPAMTRWMPEFQEAGIFALIGFLLSSGALGINFGYPGQPHVLVRFMALRDRKDAIVGGFVSSTWALLILSGAITIGMIVRALVIQAGSAPDEAWLATLQGELVGGAGDAGETGLVLAAKNLIPGVLSGMVLAAVLAAICSTADSQLVVAASSAANDIYSRLIDKRAHHKAHMLVNRLTVLLLGLGAFLLVFGRQELAVFDFVLNFGWAVLGASFGPQVILILLWRRASYAGCVAGMLTGFAVALIWPHVYSAEDTGIEIYNLPLAFILAMIVNVVVSLVFPGSADAASDRRVTPG